MLEALTEQPGVTFWGLDLRSLHDQFWATLGVQVVRLGETEVAANGPRFYMLIGEHDLVGFELPQVVERLNWLKPFAMRVRIVDQRGDGYLEEVISGPDDRLVAIQRKYHRRSERSLRLWVTGSHAIARLWAEASDARAAKEAIRQAARGRPVVPMNLRGWVFDARSRTSRDESLMRLQRVWHTVGARVNGVYEYGPDVWIHETVETPPGIQLVGPIWIGAGNRLHADDVLIGPAGLPDAPSERPRAPEVVWDAMEAVPWRLGRSLSRVRTRRITKRGFDIAASLFALLATSWLYPILITLIVIEDGWPPFFAHRRQTIGGREFPCMKFRTMCKDAEKMKSVLTAKNEIDGPQFYIKDDPRLLRVGKFMRKYQLDELPQFINVLLGQMSIVGPRPSPDKENQYCPAWRESRLSVRPGITGLWQVRRTREPQTDFQEWIRYDLEYVQHQSWRLDLWIIWQTVRQLLR